MKKAILFLLAFSLTACSRQAFEGETTAVPRGSTVVAQDTTGNAQHERDFKAYWLHKEDSIHRSNLHGWE